MSAQGPGCVKTCTSGECAELFSFFSSFDGDCQSGSFLIQRNRDKLSTRKPDVGVFTQSGSDPNIATWLLDIRSAPRNGHGRPLRHVRFVPNSRHQTGWASNLIRRTIVSRLDCGTMVQERPV